MAPGAPFNGSNEAIQEDLGWSSTEAKETVPKTCYERDNVRRLFVLDQAPIHNTDAARKALVAKDTNVVFVPGGCTSIVQLADISWMKPFKDSLQVTWASSIRAGAVTPKGNLKKPS
ncbi:hypothetical protein HPB47_017413 [Ixodes persulcatus]|uniref:Uncharacterized protein n=1 Tax=Ixodes persulcatus TaxID=34615 RepID=A0AC60QPA7_IXOPE|nr:hypothetical protein HPB47_017413 [Ixodes persulcatus]